MKTALSHEGFSFLEVIGQGTTSYAKAVGKKSAADFLEDYRQRSVRISAAAKMSAAELEGKILVGTLKKTDTPEYCRRLHEQVARVSGDARRAERMSEGSRISVMVAPGTPVADRR